MKRSAKIHQLSSKFGEIRHTNKKTAILNGLTTSEQNLTTSIHNTE